MLKLIGLTAAAIFTAEALVMLFVESIGGQLSLPLRVLLDSSLLMVCVFPTLYFLVFKEMTEQIRLRHMAEEAQSSWNQSLEHMVEERTERLQRSNEDLLIEVQERAKAALALRTALNESRKGKEQLRSIINAVQDALVVVDDQWGVQVVNQTAEAMFGTSSYDLHGCSLKNFLLPWSQSPADLDRFFCREQEHQSIFLIPPESGDNEQQAVQMRFGAELEWAGQPAKVLMFYYRNDLPAQAYTTVSPT
ncbi:MAG: PAS domain-containing protein [Desulfuromonadales bacterium]|nr:PAS domain-containing protein [Desulfuromonadales bacterium]